MSETSQNKKHIYRLIPCPDYDIEKMESWLTDMAANGLFLSDFIFWFAVFEKGEPANVRYRLEAATKKTGFLDYDNGEPSEEVKDLTESYGWQYVTRRGQFQVYCSTSVEARELNTDPRVQALALDIVRKRQRSNIIAGFLWVFVYPLILLRGKPLITAVNIGTGLTALTVLLMFWSLARAVYKGIHLRKVRKKLASGEPLNHNINWRKQVKQHRLSGATYFILLIACFAFFFSGWANESLEKNKQKIQDYSGVIPFATISDFAPNGTHEYGKFELVNTIETKTDWLAPTIIRYHENAFVSINSSKVIHGGLVVDYYETKAPWLARQIAREYKIPARFSSSYKKIDLPELNVDYAFAYSDVFDTVIIQHKNKIIKATFYQTSPNYTMPLNEWVKIVADSLK